MQEVAATVYRRGEPTLLLRAGGERVQLKLLLLMLMSWILSARAAATAPGLLGHQLLIRNEVQIN